MVRLEQGEVGAEQGILVGQVLRQQAVTAAPQTFKVLHRVTALEVEVREAQTLAVLLALMLNMEEEAVGVPN